MPNASTKTNLRVVELFKTSPLDKLCDQIKSPNVNDPNDCVCFGHFDRLHIRDVPREGNLLSDIDRDIQNQPIKSNYYYPFYIFHYSKQEEAPNKLDSFWNAKLCCMVVSRIHFTPLVPEKDGNLSNTDNLLKSLETLTDDTTLPEKDNCIGDKTVAIAGEWVHCVFYHTLELGDLVVVLKSNSMESCLRVQQRLSETAAVGDMYSYCGIHSSFFQMQYSIDEIAKQWNANSGVYRLRSAVDFIHQQLFHMSVRYSIRSVSCATRFWDDLKEYPLSFVTGTADALTDLSGKKLTDLIHVSRVLLSRSYLRGDDPGDGTFDMYDAFDDIITRIGIQYGEAYSNTRDPKDKHYSGQVGNRLRDSLVPLLQRKARWIGPLATQANILLTMMYDCVLDDLSILIWPSVEALIDRLRYLCTPENKISPNQERQIESFLNCWDILANDITRLESQLTQSPQLQSSRYYIPATLMIFYMALLDQYTDLLLELDKKETQKLELEKKEDQKRYVPLRYVPLITYGLEPRTSTVCILDPCMSGVSGGDAYNKDVPLLVSLPTTLMYKPYLVSGILCHELAHYTGDTSRMREKRLDRVLTSAAGMIAHAWKLDGEYPLRPGSSDRIITEIEKELRERYKNQLQIVGLNSGDYIYQIQSALPPAFKAVYFSRDLQTSLLSRYLDSNVMYLDFITYAKSFTPSEQNHDIQVLEKQLEDLLRLYRECYADLVAALCLGLNREQYLLFMFWAENQYLSDRSPDEKHISELHYQAAMVLTALNSVEYSPYSDWPEPSEEEKKWLDKLGKHVDYFCDAIKDTHKGHILTDEPEPKLFALQSQYIPMIRYLQRCAEVISGPLMEPEVKQLRNKIKEMLMTVSGEPDFPELQKIIAQYRTDLFRDE